MDAGRTSMNSVSRRTRSRWDAYYRNYYELKRKDQESSDSGGSSKRVRNAVDSEINLGSGGMSGEKHDFATISEERGVMKNIRHVESSRNVARKRVKEGIKKNVASTGKRKLDKREKIDDDIVLISYDELGYTGEQVVSNGSSLKTGPEPGSGSGSKVDNLDEVDSGGNCGITPSEEKQMHLDVSVDLENSIEKQVHRDVSVDLGNSITSGVSSETSDGSDNSVDSDLSESEPTSEEDDEVLDEDYKVDEPSNSGSSDDSSYSGDVVLKESDEYDGESENVKKGEEEDLSNTVEDKTTFCAFRKSTRMSAGKESDTEQEKDEDTFGSLTDRNVSRKVKDDENEIRLGTRNVSGSEVLVDPDKCNDKEEICLAKFFQPSTTSKTEKKEPELGKFSSAVPIESASSSDNDSCRIERVVKRGRHCSEEKVQLHKKMFRGARKLDMIKILVDSINALKEKQFNVEENVFTQETLPLRFRFEDEVVPPKEKSEWEKHIDSLFHDLELGLRESEIDCTNPSMMENDDLNTTENDELNTTEINESPAARCGRGEHQPILDEQRGIVCKYCAAIILDIKYVLPPFYIPPLGRQDRKDSDESLSNFMSQIQFPGSASKTPGSTGARGTVWDLVPGVGDEMYPHQREGFEFIWNNIAGGIILEKLKHPLPDGRGCIISHAPGTGKTRLTIVFIQTFMKLCPTCSPVIIAPRGMLLTWEAELRKWNFHVPFHNMNKKVLSGNEIAVAAEILGQVGARTLGKDCVRLLKLYSWTRGGSILGISYTLFEKLAGENVKEGHHESIKEMLLERPGLLVLDEGHTPRNDRSLIWKALIKVATQRRIILSGTPFQNNLLELYNTLCLVNPKFANQLGYENNTSCETRRQRNEVARKRWKAFTSSIGKNKDVLKKLRAMLDPFVHVHKGTILQENLPGLRDTLVFLHPAECQKPLLKISIKEKKIFRRIRMVSLVSVHPSVEAVMERYPAHKSKLEEIASDMDAGVKIKFLMKLIWFADALGERVLVFSQFIDTLLFIKKQIESRLSWNEGRELLYMDGQLDEKLRQDSIISFNDEKSEAKVLLASTKACSEGINLVGASRVVLLDTVWNPSVEKQAISRAYRLGQKKVVYVYRLFTSGIEVRQYAQQIKKERISQLIFSPGDGQTSQSEKSRIVSEDKVLEAMLSLDKFSHIFEKIIYQPKESDLIRIFGLEQE